MHVSFEISYTNLAILLASFAASFLWCILYEMRSPIRVADDAIGYAYIIVFGGIVGISLGAMSLVFHSMVFGILCFLVFGRVAAAFLKASKWIG